MNNISALVFDLDGTIYRGNNAIKGARETIDALIDLNYQIFYLTNNSAKTRKQIVKKLKKLDFRAKPENIYCSSYALSTYLTDKKVASVYLIGTDDLKDDLLNHNIKVKNSSRVSAVVVGFNPLFNYDNLSIALEAINQGAKLIVANMDPSFPVENNKRLPGCGAIVGAIVSTTLHNPDFIVGKPNTYMLNLLCKDHDLSPKKICIVGDSPESDIKMANNFQCESMLFDPKNIYQKFLGNKIKNHHEIISLINKK